MCLAPVPPFGNNPARHLRTDRLFWGNNFKPYFQKIFLELSTSTSANTFRIHLGRESTATLLTDTSGFPFFRSFFLRRDRSATLPLQNRVVHVKRQTQASTPLLKSQTELHSTNHSATTALTSISTLWGLWTLSQLSFTGFSHLCGLFAQDLRSPPTISGVLYLRSPPFVESPHFQLVKLTFIFT